MPVGRAFGFAGDGVPTKIQFETGTGLDDITVTLSTGDSIHVQCKTHPTLSKGQDSDLAAVLRQLVGLMLKTRQGAVDLAALGLVNHALLAVADDASRNLDVLHEACRQFDLGGDWGGILSQVSHEKRNALEIFVEHIRASWTDSVKPVPADSDLAALARAFRVGRFDVKLGGRDSREAAHLLGARLYGGEHTGEAPLAALLNAVRRLIASGAPAERDGLMRELRAAGHEDTGSPDFDADILRLREYTIAEFTRSQRHRQLAIGADEGLRIKRACREPLEKAAQDGSLVVVGEPGAGKTGALVDLVESRLNDGAPAVLLSVDHLSGVSTRSALQAELALEHAFLDVLANWPGIRPGLVVIDALDASRGGASDGVFSDLVEAALARLGERWSVVVSIRTFDLKNGRRFRDIVPGAPPDGAFADPDLGGVRHFRVPCLSDAELSAVSQENVVLRELLQNAPSVLKDLLRNVFNLSIAVELIAGGAIPESIRTLSTQSDLLDSYENERMPNNEDRRAAARVVSAMVERHRLFVRQVDVDHSSTDELLRVGVLVRTGDYVEFAHHVLFDHVAGRFLLEWDDPDRLRRRMAGDPVGGLLLGPSLRFAIERMWRDDAEGRPKIWSFVAGLAGAPDLDPIITSVAVRTIAEQVACPADIDAIAKLLEKGKEDRRPLDRLLSQIARFVGMLFDRAPPKSEVGLAWAILAQKALGTGDDAFVDGALQLLWAISDRGDLENQALAVAFGAAARALLRRAWASPNIRPPLPSRAIRFVAKSYATDVPASRELLQKILDEPRFSEHASEEAPALADCAGSISATDPEFVVQLFAVLFERPAPQHGTTWLAGRRSRIMPLTSTKEQDYAQARWHLAQFLPTFLQQDPRNGTIAVVRSTLGLARASHNTPLESPLPAARG
jgi:hypothetical protein